MKKEKKIPNNKYIRTEEHNKKISESLKGLNTWMKGKHRSAETKKKISEGHRGMHHTDETKRKIRKNNLGKKRSNETKEKISEGHKGLNTWIKGKKHSEKTKQKMRKPKSEEHKRNMRKPKSEEHIKKLREKRMKYIKEVYGSKFGKHETQILDELEKLFNYKIIRQYSICGYSLDGYVPELNLAIEIDEQPKNKERDIKRQKEIENKLNCKFLRVKDKF